jgi:hypothetical protein
MSHKAANGSYVRHNVSRQSTPALVGTVLYYSIRRLPAPERHYTNGKEVVLPQIALLRRLPSLSIQDVIPTLG